MSRGMAESPRVSPGEQLRAGEQEAAAPALLGESLGGLGMVRCWSTALCCAAAGELQQIGASVVLPSKKKARVLPRHCPCAPAASKAKAAEAGTAGTALPSKQPGLGCPCSGCSLQH